jgi:ABC-type glycerol-3-phosphate transport system permease component
MQISDNRTRTPLVYLSVALLLAIAVLPFGWMLLSSLKTLQELYSIPTTWLPNAATLANYRKVLFDSNIPRYFVNSTIVSVGSTVLGVVFATPAGYSFSRLRFRGRYLWQTLVLI